MGSTPVTCRERLTRYDERSGVGAEVLEEVGKAVEEGEALDSGGGGGELVVAETEGGEEDGECGEAHELDGLAAPGVDEEEGSPVSGNETGDDDDEVADGDVPEVLVDGSGTGERLVGGTETDGVEDDGVVETETVEGDLRKWSRLASKRGFEGGISRTSRANQE